MATNKKRRTWTDSEKEYVYKWAGQITAKEIASQLSRSVNQVAYFISQNIDNINKYQTKQLIKETDGIENSPHWIQLTSQFDEKELELFKYHWQKVSGQFREDILHTEELQIVDMIKLEVLMNRCLTQQRELKTNIDQTQTDILKERRKKGEVNPDIIMSLQTQVTAMMSAIDSISREYRELQKQKNDIFKSLKATREQRIKQIENSKESFMDWVKIMIDNPAVRKECGLYIEKMRVATEAEYKRLSEFHEFADGEIDRPILNSDTVLSDDKEKK